VDPLTYVETFNALRHKSPEVYDHIRAMLEKSHEKVYERGGYQIYARRNGATKPPM
jgi:hypothetical protein